MQHIDLKRNQGQQMSQPNIGKKKVASPNNIKKHQPKKEYSLRSKHNIKTATVSEIRTSRVLFGAPLLNFSKFFQPGHSYSNSQAIKFWENFLPTLGFKIYTHFA